MSDLRPTRRPYRKPFRTITISILLLWLLVSLACNLPFLPREPEELPPEALRETLAAMVLATAGPPLPVPEGVTPSPFPLPGPNPGLPTSTPALDPPQGMIPPTPQPPTPGGAPAVFLYSAQSGDTLAAVARRFAVPVDQITSQQPLPERGLLPPGLELSIPNVLGEVPYPSALLPDSEVVYSPSTVGFVVGDYVEGAGGFLSTYSEWAAGQERSGAEIVELVAQRTSTNPRLLLAVLEYRSNWVFGNPPGAESNDHPLGFHVGGYKGLYLELSLAAKMLNLAYYGWREGTFTELKFQDGTPVRFSPELNAGSVALQHLFAKFHPPGPWLEVLYGPEGFLHTYTQMFGDPWERATSAEPLFPAGITQPPLELPFQPGERWSLTGGPHIAWNTGTPTGALDFAPVTGEPACTVSRAWVTASAPGIVARTDDGVVVLDLDGDGYEQTGWVLLYLHIAAKDRVQPGTIVSVDALLGHPSCEGGSTTGTHVHIARKYNGEWVEADGPLPFVLSGWTAQNGPRKYEGFLVKDELIVSANPSGPRTSIIVR